MSKEALKLALEALEKLNNTNSYWWQEVDRDTVDKIEPAITAIKEALAQPEHDCTRSHPHEEMNKECELRTEIARLTNCLKRANSQTEHFEREWYLRGDEIERLKAQPEQEPVASIFISGIGEREFDDWGHDLPVGRNLLYTTPPAQQEPVAKKKHEPKIDLGKYAGTYGGYTTPEPSEGYLQKAYRLANELRSHLSIAPAQRKPLTNEQIRKLVNATIDGVTVSDAVSFRAVARAIEAAHGIKE
jgi:hypothetical protein